MLHGEPQLGFEPARSMASLTADLGEGDKAQLKAWFAAQRARATARPPLTFPLTAAAVFGAPAGTTGGALGVDFVTAQKSMTKVDLGPQMPECEGRPKLQSLRLSQKMGEGGIGAVVWNCGRAVCDALPRLPELRGGRFADPETRILELGCGTGLVGLACWLRGAAHVALTDLPSITNLARENAAATVGAAADGALPPGLICEPHAWGDPLAPALAGPYDVVIGSDCLYDAKVLPLLLTTILAATNATSVVYLAYKRRVDEREQPFFADLETHFASVAFSETSEIPEEWRGTGLHICRISGKRPPVSPPAASA